jgi:hypothetical protein
MRMQGLVLVPGRGLESHDSRTTKRRTTVTQEHFYNFSPAVIPLGQTVQFWVKFSP